MNPQNDQAPQQQAQVQQPEAYRELFSPVETSQPPRRKWPWIVGALVLVLVGLATIGLILLAPLFDQADACLTDADYTALTGQVNHEPIDAINNFYTYTVEYANNGTEYLPEYVAFNNSYLKNLTAFYQQRQTTTSMTITISGDYTNNTAKQVVEQRVADLKASLRDKGIPATAIKTTVPQKGTPEPYEPYDLPVYLTLTSDAECRLPSQ